jgi:hypothetical protein
MFYRISHFSVLVGKSMKEECVLKLQNGVNISGYDFLHPCHVPLKLYLLLSGPFVDTDFDIPVLCS